MDKPRYTVWGYMSTLDESRAWLRRTTFFYAGSPVYDGGWMRPTDSVWFVPVQNPWAAE